MRASPSSGRLAWPTISFARYGHTPGPARKFVYLYIRGVGCGVVSGEQAGIGMVCLCDVSCACGTCSAWFSPWRGVWPDTVEEFAVTCAHRSQMFPTLPPVLALWPCLLPSAGIGCLARCFWVLWTRFRYTPAGMLPRLDLTCRFPFLAVPLRDAACLLSLRFVLASRVWWVSLRLSFGRVSSTSISPTSGEGFFSLSIPNSGV